MAALQHAKQTVPTCEQRVILKHKGIHVCQCAMRALLIYQYADCMCWADAKKDTAMEATWWCCRAEGGQCATTGARLPTTRTWGAHPGSQPALCRRPGRLVPQQEEGLRHLRNL